MLQQFTKMFVVRTITAIAVAGGLAISTAIAAPLEENIATSYTILGTSINWQTSGALQPSSAGSLDPSSESVPLWRASLSRVVTP